MFYTSFMFERCLFFNSNSLTRKLNRIWNEAYSESGLSAPHAYMLRMIAAELDLTQKEIARQLQLEKSTITRFADVLIEKGLIAKKITTDARQNILVATAKGKKLAVILDEIGNELYGKIKKEIGESQFNDAVKKIKKVAQSLT